MENQLNKITYLLGAGASASKNALPIVANYCDQINIVEAHLSRPEGVTNKYLDDIKQYRKMLSSLVKEVKKVEMTIDTYAESLYKSGQTEKLNQLKETLIFFFSYKQYIEMVRDKRYHTFITKLVENKLFPNNVKILNWNYDQQVQLAGDFYSKEHFEEDKSGFKNQLGLVNYYPPVIESNDDKTSYSMIHLNGIAGFSVDNNSQRNHHLNLYNNITDLNSLMEAITTNRNNHNLFYFSFEKNSDYHRNYSNKIKHLAEIMIAGTNILVVIGYSFPDDNFDLDNFLIKIMKKTGLSKIIIQDINRKILEKFKSIFQFDQEYKNIQFNDDISKFEIPIERLQPKHKTTFTAGRSASNNYI